MFLVIIFNFFYKRLNKTKKCIINLFLDREMIHAYLFIVNLKKISGNKKIDFPRKKSKKNHLYMLIKSINKLRKLFSSKIKC